MPVEGPKSPENWEAGYLSGGVSPTLDGGLENTPNNRIRDAAMQDLVADGGTRTMRLLSGKRLDGHHFYSTPEPASTTVRPKQSEIVKQTGLPDLDRVRLESEPIVATGPRPSTPFDKDLPQLQVTKVPLAASKQGLAGPWRLAAVGIEDEAGDCTTTTEPVAFQHANGQRIEWYPPPEMSVGGKRWVLFLSEEAATEAALKASTMRAQQRAAKGVKKKVFPGPFNRKGKKRPTQNETRIGRTNAPKWGDRADLKLGKAPRDLRGGLQDKIVSVFFVFATTLGVGEIGRSLASARSPGRGFAGADGKDQAVYARPKRPPAKASGFDLYCNVRDSSASEDVGVTYRVVRPRGVYRNAPFPLDERVPIYGQVADPDALEPEAGAARVPGEDEEEGRRRAVSAGELTVLVQEDPPEEDTSGVEPPTGEMDPPVGVGASRPAAGTYLKTYAPVYGGIEQRAAVPVRVTVGADEMARLEIPNPVNRLANPAGTERGADGQALAWTSNLTNGVLADVPGSKLGVATSGLVNDTGSATPYRESDPVPVNAGVVETVRGVLEVSGYVGTGGYGVHWLIQVRPDQASLVTILKRRNTNGSEPYDVTIGPAGSGADVILDEGTTDYKIRIGTSADAGRNMTVRGYDLAAHPFDGAPRKFVFPPEGAAAIADPDAPPEAPYHPGPVVCVTKPKSAAAPPDFVPVEVLDAEGPTNPDNRGWTRNRTNNSGVGMEVTSAGAIEPAHSFRAYSNATGVRASAYWSKTYPVGSGAGFVNGSSLAVRGPFLFPLLPTRQYNQLVYLAIYDAAGNPMGYVFVSNSGNVQMVSRSAIDYDNTVFAVSGVSPSDLLDSELIVGGGNTKNGRVSFVGSLGGEQRRELASIEGINFVGRVPRQIRFMGVFEQDTAGRWEVLCDWLRVTSSGDVVAEYGNGEAPLPPDRPVGADGSYRELDEDGEVIHQLYVHVPPGFSGAGGEQYGAVWDDFYVKPGLPQTLAAYARYEDLAPQERANLRLRVFDGAGNAWEAPSPMPADLAGTSAGWQEFVGHFTPPAGHYRARLEAIRTESGMLILQDPLDADGEL